MAMAPCSLNVNGKYGVQGRIPIEIVVLLELMNLKRWLTIVLISLRYTQMAKRTKQVTEPTYLMRKKLVHNATLINCQDKAARVMKFWFQMN